MNLSVFNYFRGSPWGIPLENPLPSPLNFSFSIFYLCVIVWCWYIWGGEGWWLLAMCGTCCCLRHTSRLFGEATLRTLRDFQCILILFLYHKPYIPSLPSLPPSLPQACQYVINQNIFTRLSDFKDPQWSVVNQTQFSVTYSHGDPDSDGLVRSVISTPQPLAICVYLIFCGDFNLVVWLCGLATANNNTCTANNNVSQ